MVVPVGTPRRRRRKIIYIDLLRTAPRADGVWGLRPSGSVRGGRLYEETLVDAVVAYTPPWRAAARWYAIAATTRKKMDRRSLCQRGDGGNAMCQQRRSQSDVERVVRVRRRLLAAQQQLLDALVRQAEVLHRVRVLHEQLEQLDAALSIPADERKARMSS